MAVATIRRENESNEKLISRWKKKTQQSGLVPQFREKMTFKKPVNKTKEKERAKMREKYRDERKKNQFYS
jgi:ribosomal protein S21